jgi:hypothetical protein
MELLWFKYGNGGSCSSNANHKFFQRHVEGQHVEAAVHMTQITADCKAAFEKIMKDDFSELSPTARRILDSM